MTLAHPAYAQVREVTPIVSVMLENNPGMMTLDGTNTWILRAPGGDECVVVDPGDADEEHLARVAALGPVALTLITHRHFDHTGGVQRFFELTGAPVRSVDPEFLRGGGETLVDGETIDVAGLTLTVIATPGHTKDSVSFTVEGEGTVLTGDTILGRGTTVLDDTDGDLGDYLSSLRRLLDLGTGHRVMPGHGPELPELNVVAQQYLDHREERLDQVRAALGELGGTPTVREVVEHVYSDVDPKLWPVAEKSVNVQLAHLRSLD
ncbi:MBL fold metallo-hydrolase [Rhodococcus opacus]|uniref:MBL fold metallo-hydrolase n=1 Tax=Rhodococcus opacus TaxID=37919 RepID=UPI001FF61EC2|nr:MULTISPECIES: MBL fold metallo-hydrolase [Rhodococcus]UOT04832.1 MBL fold metallo-hydrolase [Rhodococcus opacus]GLK39555.1 MBL fold metallo-hydrolase [Rhodococcus wratislaviensis]